MACCRCCFGKQILDTADPHLGATVGLAGSIGRGGVRGIGKRRALSHLDEDDQRRACRGRGVDRVPRGAPCSPMVPSVRAMASDRLGTLASRSADEVHRRSAVVGR